MNDVPLLSFVSSLHDPARVAAHMEWLKGVEAAGGFRFDILSPDDGRGGPASVAWVRTGGTESAFLKARHRFGRYVALLTNPGDNSLAAAMEIFAFMKHSGMDGEILSGRPEQIGGRVREIWACFETGQRLRSSRLGVIGAPSEWLIASRPEIGRVEGRWGAKIVEIPIGEFEEAYARVVPGDLEPSAFPSLGSTRAKPVRFGSLATHAALRSLVRRHALDGLTLRCFDMVTRRGETGCVALSLLNDEGVPAACEGDLPSLFTMCVGAWLCGTPGFMCNPAEVDERGGTAVFAHCTIPLAISRGHEFHTHFESGAGQAIRGAFPLGPCTLARVFGPSLDRLWAARGEVVENLSRPDLCRTQVRVRFHGDAKTLLEEPVGNHRVIFPGDYAGLFRKFFSIHPGSSLCNERPRSPRRRQPERTR